MPSSSLASASSISCERLAERAREGLELAAFGRHLARIGEVAVEVAGSDAHLLELVAEAGPLLLELGAERRVRSVGHPTMVPPGVTPVSVRSARGPAGALAQARARGWAAS